VEALLAAVGARLMQTHEELTRSQREQGWRDGAGAGAAALEEEDAERPQRLQYAAEHDQPQCTQWTLAVVAAAEAAVNEATMSYRTRLESRRRSAM
jgi:hypothetical protein